MIELEIEKIYEQGALVIDGLSIGMDIVKFFPLARASNFEFYEAYRAYIASRGDTVPYKSLEALQESGEILERMGPRYLDSIELGNTEFNNEYLARLKNRKTLRSMIVELWTTSSRRLGTSFQVPDCSATRHWRSWAPRQSSEFRYRSTGPSCTSRLQL